MVILSLLAAGRFHVSIWHFSWPFYGVTIAAYSWASFRSKFASDDIFSRKNKRPRSAILTIHLVFLTLLAGTLKLAVLTYSAGPDWLTAHGFRGSILDFLYLAALFCLFRIEQRWIYVESDSML